MAMKKPLLKKLTTILVLVLLAACSPLNQNNLDKIKSGMSEPEVKAILGNPSGTETSSALGMSASVYTYISGKHEVKVTFVNGKVFSVAGRFSD